MRENRFFRLILTYETDLLDEEFLKFQSINAKVKKSWYTCLDNIFGLKTPYYDGYVKHLKLIDSNKREKVVEMLCYIVYDENKKIDKFKQEHGIAWEKKLDELIVKTAFDLVVYNVEAAAIPIIPVKAVIAD